MSGEIIGAVPPLEAGPPKMNIGVVGWIRMNLFNTWYNSILTVLSLSLIYYTVTSL